MLLGTIEIGKCAWTILRSKNAGYRKIEAEADHIEIGNEVEKRHRKC